MVYNGFVSFSAKLGNKTLTIDNIAKFLHHIVLSIRKYHLFLLQTDTKVYNNGT